jgi:hypothetical protein
MALNFSSEEVNVNSFYKTGGTVTYTMTGFTVAGTTKTITSLYNHFHSVADSRLYNLTKFIRVNADPGGLYCPATMISSTASSALSSAIYVPNAANALYVVVIGAGGGGGGGKSPGNAGGSAGGGGLVGNYYSFSVNGVSPANNGLYLRYVTGAGGAGRAVNSTTTGGTGGSSILYLYNSSNTLLKTWTANGGTGGGAGQSSGQPLIAGAGGTASPTLNDTINCTVTGGAPSLINVNSPGTAGAAAAFTFANTTAYPTTCFNVSSLSSGNGGLGGFGDGASFPSGSAGASGNDGAVFAFVIY